MKLNFKKIASILFIFSILLSTLQITALTAAESPIKIQVGGTLSKLEDAVETANNKGSAIIEIIDNISVTNNIVITSDITLVSANGNHIISVSPSGSIIVKNGNLIIGDDAKTDLLTILSSDETVHVESGTIHIKDGGTVSANGNNCKAIHVDNGDVMVSGGTVSATGDYCTAIEVITGNVIVSGGEIIASMDIGHCCYAICLGDWQNTVSGTVTITGGNVLASSSILGDSFAISLQMGGLAAYLKGTCTGDFEVWGSGIIVEVNSLEIPSVYGGTSNGLNHIEGIALTNVKWDLSGTNPVINFNNEQYKAEWISLNVEPPVTSVGKPVRIQNTGTSLDGELFDTISEAITTAESAGFNTFTLEIIGDVAETNNVVVTSNITIIGAEGAHIFTMSYSQQSLRFSVEGGGSLTLGDGTNANTLTISHSVRVTNGSINVKDGIIVISNGNALFLSGLNVTGVINGGRFEGGESALSMEGGAQLNEISDGVFIGKIDAVHLSDAGTKIDKISGGFFYQTDDSVTRHGHSIFVQNYAQIGEISGGYFDAARNCALVLIRGGKVGEISGGDFIVHRIGTIANNDRNAAVWIENGWESEGFQGTGIGTISGGHFVGTNFGVLAIADYSYAYINYITGGLFEGTVALQNDRGSTITEISGGQFKGSQGLLNNGRIEKISGDADILGTGSYGIYNYAGGQINEINGGKIVSSATLGYGIANSGIINLISGGTIIGDNYAINCAGMNPGRLNVVSGGVFLSKRSYAITLAYPLQLEPGLSGSKGLGRYQSGNGNIFNDESLVIYPKGYQMSST
ncbi:MAG: hypothetical protein LBH74_02125, partial [Nitrososphaerota archaeon]|nr:hypothetical protein [Nitrososphaerota archaeon]